MDDDIHLAADAFIYICNHAVHGQFIDRFGRCSGLQDAGNKGCHTLAGNVITFRTGLNTGLCHDLIKQRRCLLRLPGMTGYEFLFL